MTWLTLFFAMELGILPGGVLETYTDMLPQRFELQGTGYTEFDVEAELFGFLFIGGNAKTYVNKYIEQDSFSPVTMEYGFNAGLRWSVLEVGFRHYCTHPVIPWLYYQAVSPQWESWYREIYLRVEASFVGK